MLFHSRFIVEAANTMRRLLSAFVPAGRAKMSFDEWVCF
jgi:hypothetical protein